MSIQRPDPDRLLDRLHAEAARARRGKLKIFFGATAGVGKTYAMLGAARQQLLQGVDMVVGVVETHGRMETEVMADGMERLPLKEIPYRENRLKEFDLDGALARKPALILMDELAHSNVAGSRHPKRWQDVEELLAAGIDVYSTVNVQHLETLNDVISGITGIRVWETVPDKVFDTADEVVLVDLPPDELLQRLKEGKVYLPKQAERAIHNFFRKGNLIALRELALRRTADRVDDDMLQYRRDQFVAPVWRTRDSLLACIGPGEGLEKIVRTTARLASQLEVPWHAIYIETPALQRLPEAKRHRILRNLKLAEDLGAVTATLSGTDADEVTVHYARDHNLSKIIVGRDHPRPWRFWFRSFADRVGKRAPDLDVVQVARTEGEREHTRPDRQDVVDGVFNQWPDYAMAALGCGLAGLVAAAVFPIFELPNIVMIFLLAVVLVSVRFGRGPGVLASFLSVAIFDFFFVPPRLSFAVGDVQYLMTFAVMLVVGLITGQLTAGAKYQAKVATRREQRVRSLYEMSRDLSAALMLEQIAEIGERFIASELGARAAFLLIDDKDKVQPALPSAKGLPAVDLGIAQWAFDHGEAAGQGTDTLAASPILYLPLKAPMRLRGVLALEMRNADRLLIPEQRRLLDTFASLIAIALERVHYVEVAQKTTVQIESERLRNSVLSAISHDLRTPLASLIGLADTLLLTKPPPTGQQQGVIESMRNSAMRMNALVNNLLDMARLESGNVQLNRQWQPLEEVVGSALGACAALLEGRSLKVNLAPDLPLLNLDTVMIERVLVNLLENACKYTPAQSPIEIDARIDNDSVVLTVNDHGPGLPSKREEAIFEKFERGKKESAAPGVGLGLTICRAIMQAHGGTIRGETRASGGASFILTLPRGLPPSDDGGIPDEGTVLAGIDGRSATEGHRE